MVRDGRRHRGPAQRLGLVADPRGLLVTLERHGQLELLLEPFDGPARAVALDLAPPAEQEAELEALGLPVRLLVVAEELADPLDAPVDLRERLERVVLRER